MTCPRSYPEVAADVAPPVQSAQSALSRPATCWDLSQPCCPPPRPPLSAALALALPAHCPPHCLVPSPGVQSTHRWLP